MKKRVLYVFLAALVCVLPLQGQQLPDSHFENWTDKFNGDVQPADWHGSNVNQVIKSTLLLQKPGRSGFCAYVSNRKVGAMGITEIAPGYFTLGKPWQYIKGLNTKSATGGTEGGIAWTHRPDTMAVWIKRGGPSTDKEDFNLIYYAWSGTAKGSQYTAKNGDCTKTDRVNEQCDIRTATNPNACGTDEPAKQVAEGLYTARAKHSEWTLIKVPVYYMNSTVPTMCNVVFSAGNYPSPGGTEKLFEGNELYVDDVEMIYSSRIDKLVINGTEWADFDPNSDKVQTYKLPAAGDVKIDALRGVGSLTSSTGKKVACKGRKLDSKEMTVTPGAVNGAPWVIVVKAEDGSSTHTYKIKIVG
jgi:hypothetical protein